MLPSAVSNEVDPTQQTNKNTPIASRLTELRFYVPPDTKWVILETFFPTSRVAQYSKTKAGFFH